jgi:hypothetical protein
MIFNPHLVHRRLEYGDLEVRYEAFTFFLGEEIHGDWIYNSWCQVVDYVPLTCRDLVPDRPKIW